MQLTGHKTRAVFERYESMCRAFRTSRAAPPCADQNSIAAEMIDRRHEKRVIDALEDLVGP
jgi:hypothetical protein